MKHADPELSKTVNNCEVIFWCLLINVIVIALGALEYFVA